MNVRVVGQRVTIDPIYVRAAVQSAAGQGLKVPSVAWEVYVANYLSNIFWTVDEPCSKP